jgi:hypothetical protein
MTIVSIRLENKGVIMKYLLCLTVIEESEEGDTEEVSTPLILKEYKSEAKAREQGFRLYEAVIKKEVEL